MIPWPLARLGARRALPPVAWVGLAAVLGLAMAIDWVPENSGLGSTDLGGTTSALTRQGIWCLTLFVLLPFAVLQSGRIVPGWRRADVEWLAQSLPSAGPCLALTWLGQLAVMGLALVLIAVGIESQVDSSAPVEREGPPLDLASMVLTSPESRAEVRVRIDANRATEGTRLQSEFFAWNAKPPETGRPDARGGLSLEVRRLDLFGETLGRSIETVRVGRRARLEVDLPPGGGEYSFSWTRGVDTPMVLLPRGGARLLFPAGGGHVASLDVILRSLLLLAAATGLAVGVGAWTRSSLGFGVSIAVLLALEFLPGGGLGESKSTPLGAWALGLESLGRGRLAPAMGWGPWAWSLGAALVGLGLGSSALRVWRRAP